MILGLSLSWQIAAMQTVTVQGYPNFGLESLRFIGSIFGGPSNTFANSFTPEFKMSHYGELRIGWAIK
jgi:hypothetical protein